MKAQTDIKVVKVNTKVETQADIEVTTQADEEVEALANMEVTTQADTKSFVHIGGGFLREPNDRTLLIAYVDHVAFRL